MVHSLEETGFSIILFTGTHRGFPNYIVHRNRSVRLILGPDMILIWNEATLLSGAKSRFESSTNGKILNDFRFFSYVWPSVDSDSHKSRSKARVNSGENIHR